MGIVRHLNWLIAAALVALGVAVIRYPFLIDPNLATAPTSAATFAGALFGAGALFLGNQFNEYWRRCEARDQLKNRQDSVRAVLDNEFVRVSVNHIRYARELLASLNCAGSTSFPKEPTPTPIFENLRQEMLCLPATEIDALCTFYGGLDATRREIKADHAFNVLRMLECVSNDLKAAEKVVKKVWPTRKVQFPGGQPRSLADTLHEQVAAIAEKLDHGGCCL